MHPHVHWSTIYNNQDIEAAWMSIHRGKGKEDAAYIYENNGMLLSHKRNKIESVAVRWMNLETVRQSEVSQKEKNSY